MSTVEDRLHALGYVIPDPLRLPPGVTLPFPWVRVVGNRALISGHGPTNADGSLAEPLGKVGSQVTQEQAFVAARLTGMAILGSIKRELGSLERIACWTKVFGMVNSAPGFNRQPAVINGFTELILAVFGHERGAHARSAVGMAELPFNIPVEIEGEVEGKLGHSHCAASVSSALLAKDGKYEFCKAVDDRGLSVEPGC